MFPTLPMLYFSLDSGTALHLRHDEDFVTGLENVRVALRHAVDLDVQAFQRVLAAEVSDSDSVFRALALRFLTEDGELERDGLLRSGLP